MVQQPLLVDWESEFNQLIKVMHELWTVTQIHHSPYRHLCNCGWPELLETEFEHLPEWVMERVEINGGL